jgi:hypothetical protein
MYFQISAYALRQFWIKLDRLCCIFAVKVSHLSCVMAFSKPEPEPDFVSVSNSVSFDPNAPVIENDFHEFVSILESETPDIILVDTNTKVPGRIKGRT